LKRKNLIRCIICTILLSSKLWAQQPYAININRDDDLTTNAVFSLKQDAKGYIWLGTSEGLYRYDGYSAKPFKSPHQSSLSGSNINLDRLGRVWYQNFDGFLYYVENETMHHLKQNSPMGFVSYGLSDKYLFVIQKEGVDVFDIEELKIIKTIPIDLKEIEHANYCHGNYYLFADNILYKIDSSLTLTQTDYFANKKLHVKQVYPFKDKIYVVSKRNEEGKLYFFDLDLNFIKSVSIPWLNYVQGSDVIDDKIWFHTPQGSSLINENGKLVIKEALFSDQNISQVIKDKQDCYWFSTVTGGVFLVPRLENKMFNIDSLGFYTLEKSINGYLMGTIFGEIYSTDENLHKGEKLYSNKSRVPIYNIHYDAVDNNILFSDNEFSIIPNLNRNKIQSFEIAVKDVARIDNKYYALAASGFYGLLLNPLAPRNAVSEWDALFAKNQDAKIPQIARLKRGIRAKSVEYLTKKNQLFFSTSLGTFIVSPDSVIELKYHDAPLYSNFIVELDNELFIASNNGTILKYEDKFLKEQNSTWRLIPEEVVSMKKSGEYLLIRTASKLYVYKNGSIKHFMLNMKKKYVRDYFFNGSTIFVLTTKELISLDVRNSYTKNENYFYITDFRVNHSKYDFKKFNKLDYDQNNISIKFSIIEYLNKYTPIYYRINGKDWTLIDKDTRVIEFPALSPGEYHIEFKVDNVLNKDSIFFEITQPIWKTWWFYLVGLCLIVSIVYFYFSRRSQLMKRQIKLLREKNALEKNLSKSILASVKSQMNPHFFYNALNTIQAYIFVNDRKNASNYLSKFSKLTRLILEMSERENISLREEINALKLYLDLEKMRFSDSFEYDIKVSWDIDQDAVEFPPMLLQPYVENAVKHGLLHKQGEKNILIRFERKDDLLIVDIDDNGIGRKRSSEINEIKNKKHQSFSTQANEKRLEILNQGRKDKIAVEFIDKFSTDGNAMGILVRLYIPF